jgi:hypothetical protein
MASFVFTRAGSCAKNRESYFTELLIVLILWSREITFTESISFRYHKSTHNGTVPQRVQVCKYHVVDRSGWSTILSCFSARKQHNYSHSMLVLWPLVFITSINKNYAMIISMFANVHIYAFIWIKCAYFCKNTNIDVVPARSCRLAVFAQGRCFIYIKLIFEVFSGLHSKVYSDVIQSDQIL